MRNRRHALGQNFLHHKPTIAKIAAAVRRELERCAAEGRAAKSIVEVGPGKLALTHALDPIAEELKLPLVLVERDRQLEEGIRGGAPRAELHYMDAAGDEFPRLLDEIEQRGQGPIFFTSNLPYSAASQILANLCRRSKILAGAVVMVQKEMAERMVAKPGTGDRGSFSLLMQSYFETEWDFDVSPGAFNPPPKVMSSVLTLRPLATPVTAGLPDPLKFEHFCKMLFSQRRKMIRKLVPPERHALFPKLGISGTERPETLELSTVLALYKASLEDN